MSLASARASPARHHRRRHPRPRAPRRGVAGADAGVAPPRCGPAGADGAHRLPRRRRRRSLPPRGRTDRGGGRRHAGAGRDALGEPQRRVQHHAQVRVGHRHEEDACCRCANGSTRRAASSPTMPSAPRCSPSDPGERPIAVLGAHRPRRSSRRRAHRARTCTRGGSSRSRASPASPWWAIRPTRSASTSIPTARGRSASRPTTSPPPSPTPTPTPPAAPCAGASSASRSARSPSCSDPAQIRDIPVGPASRNIRLADIATVTPASADPRTVVRLDGTPGGGPRGLQGRRRQHRQGHRPAAGRIDLLRKQFPDVQDPGGRRAGAVRPRRAVATWPRRSSPAACSRSC